MEKLTKIYIYKFFLNDNFLPVSEAVASVTEAVLAAAVEPAIAAIIKKIMYIRIRKSKFLYKWHLSVYKLCTHICF